MWYLITKSQLFIQLPNVCLLLSTKHSFKLTDWRSRSANTRQQLYGSNICMLIYWAAVSVLCAISFSDWGIDGQWWIVYGVFWLVLVGVILTLTRVKTDPYCGHKISHSEAEYSSLWSIYTSVIVQSRRFMLHISHKSWMSNVEYVFFFFFFLFLCLSTTANFSHRHSKQKTK